MSENVIESRSDFRVRIECMEGCENPRTDGDYHLAGVVTLDNGWHSQYIDVADPAGEPEVQYAARHLINKYGWRDAHRMLERYVRILGGVSEYESPHEGPVSLWYVLPKRWVEVTQSEWDADKAREAVKAEMTEYRAWAEGETYGVIVEQRVTWVPKGHPDAPEEMVTWEEKDSTWGIIGDEYAESEAREMLNNYAPKENAE